MAFKIVSFYTLNYKEVAEKYLIPSLKRLNIEPYIICVPNLNNWKLATDYKAQFCLDCLNGFKEDIVWIDCDATVNYYPDLFDELSNSNVDIAYHLLSWETHYGRPKDMGKFQFCSGTLYFKNNEKVKQLANKWIEYTKIYSPEQKALEEAIKQTPELIKAELPREYCYIESVPGGHPPAIPLERPLISHYQVSRGLK